ncbi:hypothetical protein I5Q40_22585, partial [Serratia marcescens]|nr:hypothetical protein [Serratia marcescens]
MATTPTTNPIPSESVQDFKFNAGKVDQIVNSNVNTYVDRFGIERYTWAGALANIAPLGHPWTESEANAAIASGEIPLDAFYFVWSDNVNSIADVWQNVGGVPTKTGKSYPSTEFVKEVNDVAESAMSGVDEFNLLRMYYTLKGSEKFPFYVGNVTDGALAIDKDRGLWLAGLQSAIQDYVNQLIPRVVGAYYKGLS